MRSMYLKFLSDDPLTSALREEQAQITSTREGRLAISSIPKAVSDIETARRYHEITALLKEGEGGSYCYREVEVHSFFPAGIGGGIQAVYNFKYPKDDTEMTLEVTFIGMLFLNDPRQAEVDVPIAPISNQEIESIVEDLTEEVVVVIPNNAGDDFLIKGDPKNG